MVTILKRVFVTVAALSIVAGAVPALGATETRVALIIGNSDYDQAPPLANPVNDARLMAETLRSLGFEVLERLNQDQKEMKRSIRDFGEKLERAGKDSVGLFYYAGHGVQVRGRNYIIPVDADIRRESDVDIEGISADSVIGTISFAGNRLNFVVLDACRNNPYARGFRSASRGLARMDAPRGTLIAYATSPGDVAEDGKGTNSPYTAALVKAMMEPGLSAEHVFRKTRQQVMASTDELQVPWESSSLTGDFFFKEKAPEVAVQAQSQETSDETPFWQSAQQTGTSEAFKAYLERYPQGVFAVLAEANLNYLARQEQLKLAEQKRLEDETARRAEEARRLEEQARRLEEEARRREEDAKRREEEATRRFELAQEQLRLETERLRKLREQETAAAAQRAASGGGAPQLALVLPPAPEERVRFGTVKLVRVWATGKQRNGDKDALFKRYDAYTTDILQTVTKGTLHVAFDDESMLRMGASSDAIVESFGANPETGGPTIALALKKGSLRFSAPGTAPASATVRTVTALIELEATDFAVEVTQDRTTRLVLFDGEGVIASTRGGAAVPVKPGLVASVNRDETEVAFDRPPQSAGDPESVVIAFKEDYGLSNKGFDTSGAEGSGDNDHSGAESGESGEGGGHGD